jgi:hypothetical protein
VSPPPLPCRVDGLALLVASCAIDVAAAVERFGPVGPTGASAGFVFMKLPARSATATSADNTASCRAAMAAGVFAVDARG